MMMMMMIWTQGERALPRLPSLQYRPLLDSRSSFDPSLLLLSLSLRLHLLLHLHLHLHPPLPRSLSPNLKSPERHPANSLSSTITNHSLNNTFSCRPLHMLLHLWYLTKMSTHPRVNTSKTIPSMPHNLLATQYHNLSC